MPKFVIFKNEIYSNFPWWSPTYIGETILCFNKFLLLFTSRHWMRLFLKILCFASARLRGGKLNLGLEFTETVHASNSYQTTYNANFPLLSFYHGLQRKPNRSSWNLIKTFQELSFIFSQTLNYLFSKKFLPYFVSPAHFMEIYLKLDTH